MINPFIFGRVKDPCRTDPGENIRPVQQISNLDLGLNAEDEPLRSYL